MKTSFESTSSFFCSSPFRNKNRQVQLMWLYEQPHKKVYMLITLYVSKRMLLEFTCTLVSPASPISFAKPACKPQYRWFRCNNAKNTRAYLQWTRFFPGPHLNRILFQTKINTSILTVVHHSPHIIQSFLFLYYEAE